MGDTDCGGNWVLFWCSEPCSVNQFFVDGQDCVPSLLFYLRPNYGGGNEDNGDLLQKVPCRHFCTQCPQTCSKLLQTTLLPKSKSLLISWLQSPSAVIVEPKKLKSFIISIFSHLFAMSHGRGMGRLWPAAFWGQWVQLCMHGTFWRRSPLSSLPPP